jgi:glycosyltransferase involved in cell wall biosynthesis
MRKKKILFLSNYHRRFTGFGKNLKNVLCYLENTGKYELVEAANGIIYGDKNAEGISPWKTIGTLPNDPQKLEKINQDPQLGQLASYGHEMIDQIIEQEKPDIFVGIEDYWGFTGFTKRPWWNKINCMIWTTLDSLPIYSQLVDDANDIKYLYSWASFASKDLNEKGFSHVGHLRGALSNENFYKIDDDRVKDLKSRFKVENDFIVGFVFRNQLRKTVPSLLEALCMLEKEEEGSNVKLLLHTNWKEGWDIIKLIKSRGVDPSKILTTYFCSNCKDYAIHNFVGHDLDCPSCKSQKTFNTVSIDSGVLDFQLNEIYNIMDFYVHPFTSGGQEIPIQEAMMSETPIACTSYSCGTDFCSEESGGMPLDWNEYVEFNSGFIKAHTKPESIVSAILKVKSMSKDELSNIGKKCRNYILSNYSIDVIGKQLEIIFDSMPVNDYDFNFSKALMNPMFPKPEGLSDSDFVKSIYKNMLHMEVDENDQGYTHWMSRLSSDLNRDQVYNYFKSVASNHNDSIKKSQFNIEDLLDEDDCGKRIAVVLNQDPVAFLMSTYFFKNLSETYEGYNIYVFIPPEFKGLVVGNEYVHKILPSNDFTENIVNLEGGPYAKRHFEVAYIPHQSSLMLQTYAHNESDKSSTF